MVIEEEEEDGGLMIRSVAMITIPTHQSTRCCLKQPPFNSRLAHKVPPTHRCERHLEQRVGDGRLDERVDVDAPEAVRVEEEEEGPRGGGNVDREELGRVVGEGAAVRDAWVQVQDPPLDVLLLQAPRGGARH